MSNEWKNWPAVQLTAGTIMRDGRMVVGVLPASTVEVTFSDSTTQSFKKSDLVEVVK